MGVLAVFAAPYVTPELTQATENAQFMSGFVGGWRNNDSLFGILLYLAGGDLYNAKYAAFAVIAAAWVWLSLRDWPLERVALWGIVILLLVSANCHPWYLTWFLPLLAVYPYPSLVLWVSVVPLAYSVRIAWDAEGVWQGSTPERWWIYGPVLALHDMGHLEVRGVQTLMVFPQTPKRYMYSLTSSHKYVVPLPGHRAVR